MLNVSSNDFIERLTVISPMLAESFFPNSQYTRWAQNAPYKHQLQIIIFANQVGVFFLELDTAIRRKKEIDLFSALNSAQITKGESLKNYFNCAEMHNLMGLYKQNLVVRPINFFIYSQIFPALFPW